MTTRADIYSSRYLAGRVLRYHTWPMLHQQTVAAHAWRVACIYVEVFGLPRAEVLYYCLHHDSGEQWAGDLPFGIKAAFPKLAEAMHEAEIQGQVMLDITLPELTPDEKTKCKICDLLEMWETGTHEYNLGNNYAKPVIHATLGLAQRLAGAHYWHTELEQWLKGKRHDGHATSRVSTAGNGGGSQGDTVEGKDVQGILEEERRNRGGHDGAAKS